MHTRQGGFFFTHPVVQMNLTVYKQYIIHHHIHVRVQGVNTYQQIIQRLSPGIFYTNLNLGHSICLCCTFKYSIWLINIKREYKTIYHMQIPWWLLILFLNKFLVKKRNSSVFYLVFHCIQSCLARCQAQLKDCPALPAISQSKKSQ